MKNLSSLRLTILLTLSLTVTAVLALTAGTPAFAACTPGAVDKPDLGFVDSNCDGIDGDKAGAIFVAPGGSDANDGSFGHPMATVAAAVVAGLAAHKDVYVAAGTYDGKVSIIGEAGQIGVYGGYDPATWARSAANVTTLQGPHEAVTIAVPGIVLQLLTLRATTPASTSYGVRMWNHGEAALSRDTVEPAAGGNGSDGASAPLTQPVPAPNGKQGVGNPNCNPGKLSGTFNPGAKGGEAAGLLSGGAGGDWFKPYPFSGTNGQSDPEHPTVGGGIGGEMYWPGGLGSPGLPGAPGLPGLDRLNVGTIIYAAMSGTAGGSGTRGAGGGGGGMSENTCMPGSGGGAGGRPGAGGYGGSGGGGSIGIFVGEGAHAILLDGTVVHAADGGKGGNGGLGQPGGAGGEGGLPGAEIYGSEWGPGTSGGNGGNGGNGGQGGGGAGGASLGVLAVNGRAVVEPDVTITVGEGGYGGQGGHDGWQGISQPTAQVTTLNGSLPPIGDFDGDGVNDEADACPIAAGPGNGCPSPDAGSASTGSGQAPRQGAATISVLPGGCFPKGAFKIHLNPRKTHMKSASLTLDGRRLKLVKGRRRWTAKVDLSRSNRSNHTLTIRGKLSDGRSFKQTRHYRTCAH
ncbi:MAG TPA: hypothetical protein VH476_02000 [Solirubrobacterales bacterium]